jgi:Trk-type K+ transport system membrane component
VLAFVESDGMIRDPANITPFFLLFEIASAYGGVGVSVNAIGQVYSLSGDLRPVSQVGIMLVMMLGTLLAVDVIDDRAVVVSAMRGCAA